MALSAEKLHTASHRPRGAGLITATTWSWSVGTSVPRPGLRRWNAYASLNARSTLRSAALSKRFQSTYTLSANTFHASPSALPS